MIAPKLTSDRLNNHLSEAADILRAAIGSSDYRLYLFAFLFLKRLSDRFDEEVEEQVARGVDREDAETDPDYHPFFVPARASWAALGAVTQNIGETLNGAAAALEEANPSLEGVLLGVDFNDERRLGDALQRDLLLHRLIGHFSEIALANSGFSEPDLLGRVAEALIARFADDAGRRGGTLSTPPGVVALLVALLDPAEGQRVCDPTCGAGGMLLGCARHVAAATGRALGTDILDLTLHGQEKDLCTWAICKMNLILHGLPDARVERGDTIRQPRLVERGELLRYDRVIASPPFSLDRWGAAEAASDAYHRFDFGIPPKNMGDFAFVQHMVATLNDAGTAGVVLPHGVLFRGGGDGQIRRRLLEKDWLEGIIGLPENLFPGTGIPTVILLLNRRKRPEHRGKVLFIHAAEGCAARANLNILREQDIRRMVEGWRAWRDEDRFSRVVDVAEILGNEGNLNISRYVETLAPEQPVDLAALVVEVKRLEAERDEAARRLDALLEELDLGR